MRPLCRFLALLAILFILAAPSVTATPTVVSAGTSIVAVNGTADYFQFPDNGAIAIGATWQITAPSGQTLTLTRNTALAVGPTNRFSLNGVQTMGTNWVAEGDLTGAPADGTWVMSIHSSSGEYQAIDSDPSLGPGPTLHVSGKGIHFGVVAQIYNTGYQTWNWPQTAAATTWNEPSTVPSCSVIPTGAGSCSADVPNEAADEDPNLSKFFSDVTPPNSPFTAYTLHSTINCAGTGTVTMNGAWLGATGTAFSRFAYVDGDFLGTTDLRTIIGAAQTTEENEGATPAGTDTKSVSYNNAAGVSYQFIMRTSAQGEALGVVQWTPSLQCTQAGPTIALADVHQEDTLSLTVSQAQCSQDFTSFSMDLQIGNVLTVVSNLNLYIQNAQTGTTILTVPQSSMFAVGNRVQYYADVFPTGSYIALAKITLTGVGAGVFYDSAAFNSPRGSCDDTATLNAIAQARADILATVGLTVICDEAGAVCNFNFDNETLNRVFENITDHREHSLELTMVNDFSGLGFDGFLFAIGWMVAMWLLLRRAKAAAALIAMLGLLEEWLGDVMPGDRLGYVMLFILVLWLESFGDHLWRRWTKKEEKRESEPL